MDKILNIAVQAAKQAGEFIQGGAQRLDELVVEQKSLHDYVSEIDRGSENIIRDCIRESYPSHRILGEEFGVNDQTDSSNPYQWIIDPLDGTTNFLRGIPHYAVSIGVMKQGELIVAVVYDPAKGELFSACQGCGAFLNNKPIAVSHLPNLSGALLSTGVPYSGKLLENVSMFSAAMENLLAANTSGIRRLGAAALDLAYVAAGRYDGFWETNLKIWDIAAGALLVTEAGGQVSDYDGEQAHLESGNIVAAPVGVHSQMQPIVGKAYEGW